MKTDDMIKKLEFFKDNEKEVHVKLSDRFYNGTILYLNNKKDILVLLDLKLGEVPILFEEIERVEPFIRSGL